MNATQKTSKSFWLLVVLAAAARLVPHPWNLTPVGGLSLFSGAYLRGPVSWLAPLVCLLIGDAVIGFYDWRVMLCVYLGFIATGAVGRVLLARRRTPLRVGSGCLLGALVFFLISNIGSWIAFYPRTATGLLQCYINGLPYFGYTLLGNLMYGGVLFGLFEWLQQHFRDHSLKGNAIDRN